MSGTKLTLRKAVKICSGPTLGQRSAITQVNATYSVPLSQSKRSKRCPNRPLGQNRHSFVRVGQQGLYMLTVDYFSNFFKLGRLHSTSTISFVRKLLKEPHRQMASDQGPESYISRAPAIWSTICHKSHCYQPLPSKRQGRGCG